MPRRTLPAATLLFALASVTATSMAADEPKFTREQDVIYGRKLGMALTLDVFRPEPRSRANGVGLIWVVSGGWYSSHDAVNAAMVRPFTDRGYTVFAVVHGSQPRFPIPDVLQDMHRSVRFVRSRAKDYGVDPDRLGIYGGSAGGHLSLMMGTAGAPGSPNAPDPVDRASSRVQAVACFFPPTDFLNYGREGVNAMGRGVLEPFKAAFDFQEVDRERRIYVPIVDEAERVKIGRAISPVTHVGRGDAPTLILHGDADTLVPIQQAQRFVAAMKKAEVPVELVVKTGAGHGWPRLTDDLTRFADWFDEHLKASGSGGTPGGK